MSPMTVSVCLAVLVVTVEYGAIKPSSNSKVKVGVVIRQPRTQLQKMVHDALKNYCSGCKDNQKRAAATKAFKTLMEGYHEANQKLAHKYNKMYPATNRGAPGGGRRVR